MSQPSFATFLATYRKQFSDYTLTELGAAPARVFLLRKPEWERMEGVDIVFLGSDDGRGPLAQRIVITGDLCPARNDGCASPPGYTLGWLRGATSHDYLCSNFLRERWVPANALDVLKDARDEVVRELAEDGLSGRDEECAKVRLRKLREAIEEAGDEPENCGTTRSAEAFCDLWIEVFGTSPEDEGVGYDPRDVALLVAIQEAFARLYEEHEKKAATKTKLAVAIDVAQAADVAYSNAERALVEAIAAAVPDERLASLAGAADAARNAARNGWDRALSLSAKPQAHEVAEEGSAS